MKEITVLVRKMRRNGFVVLNFGRIIYFPDENFMLQLVGNKSTIRESVNDAMQAVFGNLPDGILPSTPEHPNTVMYNWEALKASIKKPAKVEEDV